MKKIALYRFLSLFLMSVLPSISHAIVKVAVFDTGIDPLDANLAPCYLVNRFERFGLENRDDDGNGFQDDIWGWNFVEDSSKVFPHKKSEVREGPCWTGSFADHRQWKNIFL